MAGHNQSPAGSLASTSMRPYLMALVLALNLADLTGLTMVPLVVLVEETQFAHVSEEHSPFSNRSMTESLSMRAWS